MAKDINEAGIIDGQIVYADQILQITDALRGDDAYNINLTGSISINGIEYPTTDGAVSSSVLMTDGSGVTGFGQVKNAVSSSYATLALTASHVFNIIILRRCCCYLHHTPYISITRSNI